MVDTGMGIISGFEPLADKSARVLILGSMPGIESLTARQYYAHAHNAFWKIMAEILGFPAEARYESRIGALKDADIALWDVLHSCIRQGSLDADIKAGSVRVNDFQAFFSDHPNIELVCFNGKTAEKYFRKHVLPTLTDCHVATISLPSTSPAYASLTFTAKAAAWRAAICTKIPS
jgi:hypoxanthine-DNA glycosylase